MFCCGTLIWLRQSKWQKKFLLNHSGHIPVPTAFNSFSKVVKVKSNFSRLLFQTLSLPSCANNTFFCLFQLWSPRRRRIRRISARFGAQTDPGNKTVPSSVKITRRLRRGQVSANWISLDFLMLLLKIIIIIKNRFYTQNQLNSSYLYILEKEKIINLKCF